MRFHQLTESTPEALDLTESQALELEDLGSGLASQKGWWGNQGDHQGDDGTPRSIVKVSRRGDGLKEVTVLDAVGVLAVRDLQLEIQPKIPLPHLIFLLQRAKDLPRTSPSRVHALTGTNLWQLVATWFLELTEGLLRRGLMRGYREVTAPVGFVRGRIHPNSTARAFYSGNPSVVCEFEEFTTDEPLNRILKAAAHEVAGSKILPRQLRDRGLRITSRMGEVGPLRQADFRAPLDRMTAYYSDPILLAKQILGGEGWRPENGGEKAWAFLLRTPGAIERGIRETLKEGGIEVGQGGRQIPGSGGLTLTPDLVFRRGAATGDVKYKLSRDDWHRPDLYQAVTFATGFGADRAAVIGFRGRPRAGREELQIGPVAVRHFNWMAREEIPPMDAAQRLVAEVSEWLAHGQAAQVAGGHH